MSKQVPDKYTVAVVIAWKAERTLQALLDDIPRDWVDLVIVGDDASPDNTLAVAKANDVVAYRNESNLHMGGNAKAGFRMALERGADIIVLLHGDNQYDAKQIPAMVRSITTYGNDVVLGSRILGQKALAGGMPWWKFLANNMLNAIQNWGYGFQLSDYATGYKAFTRQVLQTIPYEKCRNDYVFDEEMNTQFAAFGLKVGQVPIPTRYFKEASSAGFWASVHYGLFTVWSVVRYLLDKRGIWRWELCRVGWTVTAEKLPPAGEFVWIDICGTPELGVYVDGHWIDHMGFKCEEPSRWRPLEVPK